MKHHLSHTRKQFSNNKPEIRNSCRRQVGFTLIELLVVIAIGMIIGSASLAAYNTFSRKQEVDQSALFLQSLFDEARFSALSNVLPQICRTQYPDLPPGSGATSVTKYGIVLSAPRNYSLEAVCLAGGTEKPPVTVKSGTFPRSTSYVSGAFDCGGKFYYEAISNKIYCGDFVTAVPGAGAKIKLTNGTDVKTLIITKNGKVTVN